MEVANETEVLRAPGGTFSNPSCLGAFQPLQDSAYAGSGSNAVRGQQSHMPNSGVRVFQGAVTFPNAEKAQAFVAASADKWKACTGATATFTNELRQTSHWTFGDVAGAAPTITQVRTPEDPNRPSCQRVLSAVSGVVLDVEACITNVADQGSQITQKLAAKVK